MRAQQEERSMKTLKLLLAPVVHRRIAQRHRAKALAVALGKATAPSEAGLQALPVFQQWSDTAAQRLLRGSRIVYCERGTVLALQGEPLSVAEVIWVLTGKLTDLPTKDEYIKCANNALGGTGYHAGNTGLEEGRRVSTTREVLTGPAVLPQLFATENQKLIPLSVIQEITIDRLETYAAGHLAASDGVILKMPRERSIRCVTPVLACLIPLRVLNRELSSLSKAAQQHTILVAKTNVECMLTRRDEKPSMESILLQNRMLTKLNSLSLRQAWSQLRPVVYMPNEIICPNTYVADNIYFIRRGSVRLHRKKDAGTVEKVGAAVGLNAFVPYIMPKSLNETLTALSKTYCELWTISLPNFISHFENDLAACLVSAGRSLHYSTDQLQLTGKIRYVPAFMNLPELALHQISHSMKLRVYGPGQCIITANRYIREGIIVVVGRAHLLLTDKHMKKRKDCVKCGAPYFFCEALAKKVVSTAMFAETSVITLHCSPSSVLDAMEDNGCTPQEIEQMYDLAAKYIAEEYGAMEPRIEAQLRAASRVRERKMNLLPPKPKPSSLAVLEAVRLEQFQVENELITTLVTRLQALHHDPLDLLRHQYLTDFQHVMGPSTAEWAEQEQQERKRPVVGSCFTVDENGEVVIRDPAVVQHELLEDEAARGEHGLSLGASLSVSMGLDSHGRGGSRSMQCSSTSPPSPALSKDVTGGCTSNLVRSEALRDTATPRHVQLQSPSPKPPFSSPASPPAPRSGGRPSAEPLVKHSVTEIIQHFEHRSDHQQIGSNKYNLDAAHKSVQQSKGMCQRDLTVPLRAPVKHHGRGLLRGLGTAARARDVGDQANTRPPVLPRLAAIQHLKDEAVGFDHRAEYRKHLLKHPHAKRAKWRRNSAPKDANDTMRMEGLKKLRKKLHEKKGAGKKIGLNRSVISLVVLSSRSTWTKGALRSLLRLLRKTIPAKFFFFLEFRPVSPCIFVQRILELQKYRKMVVSNILYVLGGESSGKTTLVHQIQAIADGSVVSQPYKTAPTNGQNVSICRIQTNPKSGGIRERVEMREIGGSLSPHWDNFLRSSVEHEGHARRALIYLVDATAPHQLAEATTRFLQLTTHPGECRDWPTLLVLHKSHAAHAISTDDLLFLLGGLEPKSINVLEVDAWNGFGVGDVFQWLKTTAFG
eukprot:gene294-167_t